MSEYWPADMEFGGELPKSKLQALINAIANDGASCEGYGAGCDETANKKAILKSSNTNSTVHIFNEQASYGHFGKCEEFCQKNKLTFLRHSDAYCEYSGGTAIYNPKLFNGQIISVPSDQDGHIYFTLPFLKASLCGGRNLQQVIEELELASNFIIPPLKLI